MKKIYVEVFENVYLNNEKSKYIVSCLGTVKNIKTGKILKPQPFHNGRLYVNLYLYGKEYRSQISRLVATAFIPNPNNYPVVNHLDGNVTNNKDTNLEWTTYEGNTQHALRTGLITSIGENSHLNKFSESLVINICEELMKRTSPIDISIKYGVSVYYISELKNKKTWRHITCNYDFPENDSFVNSRKYPITLKENILKLVNDGKKNKEIILKFNLPDNRAHKSMIDRIRAKSRKELR